MRIELLNYLDEKNVILNLKGKNRRKILSHVLDHLISSGKVDKVYRKEMIKVLLKREEMGSTAIGGGIALPHARLECIKNLVLCVGISPEGLDFDSLDDEPVYIIVTLLSNQKEAGFHLKILALLARMLRDKYFVQDVRHVKTEKEFIGLMQRQYNLVR